MQLVPKLQLWYTDRDGSEASISLSVPSLLDVPQAVAIANAAEAAISGVSNARCTRAKWTLTIPPAVETEADPAANIYERLIILFTNGVTVASYSIPAPRPGAYDTTGPLRDVRIQAGPHPVAQAITQLQTALASTVLADGSPFPVGEWVAGRTVNQ